MDIPAHIAIANAVTNAIITFFIISHLPAKRVHFAVCAINMVFCGSGLLRGHVKVLREGIKLALAYSAISGGAFTAR